VYESGVTYRFELDAAAGVLSGAACFIFRDGLPGEGAPVTGTREGREVAFSFVHWDHPLTLRYVLTLDASGDRMTGRGAHDTGPEENVVLTRAGA